MSEVTTFEQRRQMVKDAAAKFPAEFGLRGHKGAVFSVNVSASYVSEGRVTLYVYVKEDGRWVSFSKGSPSELRREMVELPTR